MEGQMGAASVAGGQGYTGPVPGNHAGFGAPGDSFAFALPQASRSPTACATDGMDVAGEFTPDGVGVDFAAPMAGRTRRRFERAEEEEDDDCDRRRQHGRATGV